MKQPIKAKKKKKSPLYVNDENDYRYRAYSDSTILHDNVKEFKKLDDGTIKSADKWYNEHVKNDNTKFSKSWDRLAKLNNKSPKPTGEVMHSVDKYTAANTFKKPEQPVFIKGSNKAKIAREQEKYGVEADGVWGKKSQTAKDNYIKNEAIKKKQAETERRNKIAADKKAAAEKVRLEKEAKKAKQSEVLDNGMRRVSSGSKANNLSGDGGMSGWFKDKRGNYVSAPRALKK